MSIDKIQADLTANCFREIGLSTTHQELDAIERIVDAVSPHEEERDELRRQIQMRREQWRLAETTLNKVRLN